MNKLISVALIVIFGGCSSVTNSPGSGGDTAIAEGTWLIPRNEVVDGGPPKDGIPSIDNPQFVPAGGIDYVDDNRLVVGIKIGNIVKAYPHQVLDHHEIVNDGILDLPYCLTYCPLTGTAIAWERTISGETVEFGVSGLLFRNNLIPYDRKTGSNYSQMQMRAVNGSRSGIPLNTLQVIQTTWKTWERMYPGSSVLTTNTGFNRNYSGYLYGRDYLEEGSGTLFPVRFRDNRLPNKERVLGVIAEDTVNQNVLVKVYVIDEFGTGVRLVNDRFADDDIIVAGSTDLHFAVAFKRTLDDGTELDLEPIQDALPVIMKDQEGNRWDLFGLATEGPRQGERLLPMISYSGYWFAWADFFPGVTIHQFEN